MQQTITPNLWFDSEAEEAAAFYLSIFKNSRIVRVAHYTESGPGTPGTVMVVEFELNGQRFVGINGGPQFPFTEAVSLQVNCEDQAEVDYYWEHLSDGGEPARAVGSRTATASRGRSRPPAWMRCSPIPIRRGPTARWRRC